MLSAQLGNQVIPSKTTNFLCPCNEDIVEERIPAFKQSKKEFVRSYSCDVILPKKPHPFRSPITFLRSTTLPRSYKKHVDGRTLSDHNARLKRLTLAPNDSGWSLDEEYPLCSHTPTATTDNTPFCGLSNQPYYAKRQSVSLGKLNKKKGSRSNHNAQHQSPSGFDGHYATMRPNRKDKSEEYETNDNGSLRRRASSLDFLPEASSKPCMQNVNNGKATPFGRTTSLSQRSPFRKKISYAAEQETSLQGIKELRPKGAKRLRSGLDALFDSIEKHDVDELRKVLGTVDVNINELNADQFTPLDVALMCGEIEIASILLEHGGKENPAFVDPSIREKHLDTLIEVADKKVNDYTATIVNSVGDAKDNERQLREWEWRLVMLRIMQNKFHITDSPKHIPSITIAPLSNESVVASVIPSPDEFDAKSMVTKYKVDWSHYEDFSDIEGSKLMTDKRQLSSTITGLEKNTKWYFRVQCGNLKGFSPSGYPDPRSVTPSSWHECDNIFPRYYGTSDKLHDLVDELLSFQKVICEKPEEGTSDEESPSVSPRQVATNSPKHRHKKMARGLSKYTNLIFNSAPKLLKKIKRRGIYLAALLYSDDLTHVLVTMDENLPVVECDDNYSKSFTQEIYWFSKASCTWKDINHMLYFSTKSHSSQSVQIRRKLVQSALALMNATGVTDLGPIHYKPFKDNNGSILLLAVNCIKKNVSWSRSMAMKWIPILKLSKKSSSMNDQVIAPERLIPSVQEQVVCHRRSRTKLPKGLYLGYLKLRTSVDVLSIIVPNSHTNVLPYHKIQDIPNVTNEEWHWLRNLNKNQLLEDEMSLSLKTFEKRLKKAINSLFLQLNIDKESAMCHRIYEHEVIELNFEVLFILICPPCDEMCTPPNQLDGFTTLKDYSALPFQAFEMANMMTYQPRIMSSYCRLSSMLELDNYCMQQIVRQTICHKELKLLKERQSKLGKFQQTVDELWRSSRWVFDTIQACQDKNLNVGVQLSSLYRTCDWVMVEMDQRLSANSSSGSHSDFSEIDSASFDEAIKSDNERSNSSKCDNEPCTSSKCDNEPRTSSKCDNEPRSIHGHGFSNTNKGSDVLIVHGCKEVGLDESSCIQIITNGTMTTCELIKLAVQEFVRVRKTNATETEGELNSSYNVALCQDRLQHLSLVVISGADEVCLTDDNLLEHPWNKGTIYLRFKRDSQLTASVSTTV